MCCLYYCLRDSKSCPDQTALELSSSISTISSSYHFDSPVSHPDDPAVSPFPSSEIVLIDLVLLIVSSVSDEHGFFHTRCATDSWAALERHRIIFDPGLVFFSSRLSADSIPCLRLDSRVDHHPESYTTILVLLFLTQFTLTSTAVAAESPGVDTRIDRASRIAEAKVAPSTWTRTRTRPRTWIMPVSTVSRTFHRTRRCPLTSNSRIGSTRGNPTEV
jgi:hypothetical protein